MATLRRLWRGRNSGKPLSSCGGPIGGMAAPALIHAGADVAPKSQRLTSDPQRYAHGSRWAARSCPVDSGATRSGCRELGRVRKGRRFPEIGSTGGGTLGRSSAVHGLSARGPQPTPARGFGSERAGLGHRRSDERWFGNDGPGVGCGRRNRLFGSASLARLEPLDARRGGGVSAGIVGRDRELAAVQAFLAELPRGARALLVEGEAGIGKTAVWRAALEEAAARGCRVLRCVGEQAEARLSFAGLGDLVGEVADEVLGALPEPQREALEFALVRRRISAGGVDAKAVAVGLRALLVKLALRGPCRRGRRRAVAGRRDRTGTRVRGATPRGSARGSAGDSADPAGCSGSARNGAGLRAGTIPLCGAWALECGRAAGGARAWARLPVSAACAAADRAGDRR